MLASMSAEGLGKCLAVEGASTKVIFEAYVERVLAPSLCAKQIVVMDNTSSDKGEGQGVDRGERSRREVGSFCICLPTPRT